MYKQVFRVKKNSWGANGVHPNLNYLLAMVSTFVMPISIPLSPRNEENVMEIFYAFVSFCMEEWVSFLSSVHFLFNSSIHQV